MVVVVCNLVDDEYSGGLVSSCTHVEYSSRRCDMIVHDEYSGGRVSSSTRLV